MLRFQLKENIKIYTKYIPIDAVLESGNSNGALLSMFAEVSEEVIKQKLHNKP